MKKIFAIMFVALLGIGGCRYKVEMSYPTDATRNPKNCDPIAGRPHPSCKVP